MPLVSPLAPATCDLYAEDSSTHTFDSRLSVETAVPAMTLRTILPDYQPPPGMKILKGAKTGANPENGRSAPPIVGDDGTNAPPDNSFMGFLKRYWYIILPLFIMNMMAAPPEEEQPQASGEGGAPAAAPPSAAAAAGSVRKRRGKRG